MGLLSDSCRNPAPFLWGCALFPQYAHGIIRWIPNIFLGYYYGIPLESCRIPLGVHWIHMVWDPRRIPMGIIFDFHWILSESHWSPIGFPWDSHGFPCDSKILIDIGFPLGCPLKSNWDSYGVSIGLPMDSYELSIGFLLDSHCVSS